MRYGAQRFFNLDGMGEAPLTTDPANDFSPNWFVAVASAPASCTAEKKASC